MVKHSIQGISNKTKKIILTLTLYQHMSTTYSGRKHQSNIEIRHLLWPYHIYQHLTVSVLTYYYCWPLYAKKLGSWMIARHFSLSFASIIASYNIWMCFSFNCGCITCRYVVFGLPLGFGFLPSPWKTYLHVHVVSMLHRFFCTCLVLCSRPKWRADRFRKL